MVYQQNQINTIFILIVFFFQDVHSDENNTKNANHHQTLVCLSSLKSFLLKIQYVLLVIKYIVRTLSVKVSFFDADTLEDILVKYIQRCQHNLLVSFIRLKYQAKEISNLGISKRFIYL